MPSGWDRRCIVLVLWSLVTLSSLSCAGHGPDSAGPGDFPGSSTEGPPAKADIITASLSPRSVAGSYQRAVFIQPVVRIGADWVNLGEDAQSSARSEATSLRGNLESSLFQYVRIPNSNTLERAITDNGDPYLIAYTPENRFDPLGSIYKHVVATGGIGGRENTQEGVNEITLLWELPPEDPENPGKVLAVVSPFNTSASSAREIDGNLLVISAKYEVTQLSSVPPLWQLKVLDFTLNGESLGSPGTILQDREIPLIPALTFGVASSQSGENKVTFLHNGQELDRATYIQRALAFEHPFPVFQNEVGDIIEFSNRLIWNAGDPTVRNFSPNFLNLPPRWQASIGGFSVSTFFPGPGSANWVEGTDISFRWDSGTAHFVARQVNALARFQLIPVEETISAQLNRAPEGHQRYTYSVKGEVPTYSFGPSLLTKYVVRSSGELRGRDRRVLLNNVGFVPPEVQVGESSMFRADISTLDFVDPVVTWSLSITSNVVDEEGNENSETVLEDVGPSGDDNPFQVLREITAAKSGEYHATLVVNVVERDLTNPDGSRIELSETATADLLAGNPNETNENVVEIYDGDTEELLATSDAEFPQLEDSPPDELPVFGSPGGTLKLNQPNNKFILKIPGLRKRIRVVVTNVPGAEEKEHIVVQIRTTESNGGATQDIELLKNENPENGAISFRRDIFLGEPEGDSDDPHFSIQDFQESYSFIH